MSASNMSVFLVFMKTPNSSDDFPENFTARLGTYQTVFEAPELKNRLEFVRLVQRNLYYQIIESGDLNRYTSGFRIVVASELMSVCEHLIKLAHDPSDELLSTLKLAEQKSKEPTFLLYEKAIDGSSLVGDRLYVRILLKQNNL